ncbi:DUF2971 domain-containing protein [Pseudomonas sp. S2_F03]
MADSLFHYTDAGAVKSILENQEFWLTDIRFLNDSQELNDGVVFILDALSALKKKREGDDQFILRAINELRLSFETHISHWIDSQPIFVCSFSKSGNQLSQWRAYGSYAIEFDSDRLWGDIDLFECFYDSDKKNKIVAEEVSQSVQGLAQDFMVHGDEITEDSLIHLSTLVRTASTFKDANFYEEQEVRCAIDLSLPNENLKFRQRGNLLIPYTAVKFTVGCIKAIHVGPMRDQDLAYTAMKTFVANTEHQLLANGVGQESRIQVIKSKIPFRAP